MRDAIYNLRATARERIPPNSAPRRIWRHLRQRAQAQKAHRARRTLAGPRLLRAFGRAYPHAFFIEIGSNDGKQEDHLHPVVRARPWRGIMVEPVPHVYERLCQNYDTLRDRIVLENVAIANRDGQLPFYHLREVAECDRGTVPAWYDAIGSFFREAVMTHRDVIPDLEARVICTQIPCLTFASLCARHGVRQLDVLVIDAEGYDYQIIEGIDFANYRPRLLIYEHFHLPARERAACRALLSTVAYETMEEGFDTWCLQTSTDDRLTSFWRRLRPAVPGLSSFDQAQ